MTRQHSPKHPSSSRERPDVIAAQKVLAVSLLVIVLVALQRGLAAAKRLWTQRYIRRTIPTS